MLHGLRTCPACRSRVLPTAEDTCPTCRQYKFTGAAEETAPPPPDPNVVRATSEDLYRGAQLHWRLLKLAGAFVALLLARFAVRLAGRDGVAATGFDPDVVKTAIALGLAAVLAYMWVTASSLAKWLGFVNPRTGAPSAINVPSLLKHSMAYFESKNVPVGLLGPHLSAMQQPEGEEAL